jgi:hypothetical protein
MAQTYIYNGKEQQMWTQTQLEQLGKAALKQRAMGIRDTAGEEVLPSMPRHPDLLVPWILEAQEAMSRASDTASVKPPSRTGQVPHHQQQQQEYAQHHAQYSQKADDGYSQQGAGNSEAMDNYHQAQMQRMAARQKAQGSNIFGA